MFSSARFRAFLLGVALCVIGYNVWFFRPAVSAQTPRYKTPKTWISRDQYAIYDTQGKVLGNPDRTIEQLKNVVYKNMLIYKQRNGHWPLSNMETDELEKPDFVQDRFKHYKEYGYTGPREAIRAHNNVDSIHEDGGGAANMAPYIMQLNRPDGTLFGAPKAAGTKDILAYSGLYFHNNQHFFINGKRSPSHPQLTSENHPSGFWLVMWEDGTVEKIPWQKVRYLKPSSRVCFPNQAGVDWSKTMSYDENQVWWTTPEGHRETLAYQQAHHLH